MVRTDRLDLILDGRFVLTDKNGGLRTESNPLPVEASARLVFPGFRDPYHLDGNLRCDAPTGSRNSQHMLFAFAASDPRIRLAAADVRSAFLKGDYLGPERVLYGRAPNPNRGPSIPGVGSRLIQLRKGVFGLADAPRGWFKRLSRCFAERGWETSTTDQATWLKFEGTGENRKLVGMVVGHVDDLLFAGFPEQFATLESIGEELGFSSLKVDYFTWCGKRIRRADDGTIRISMAEYHENLNPTEIASDYLQDPNTPLRPRDHSVFRGICGSLMWIVAQLRPDLAFDTSVLQGQQAAPTGQSLIDANKLILHAKASKEFEQIFRPIDWSSSGIVVVSDAALGNVDESGNSKAKTKPHSQSGYLVFLADSEVLAGRTGVMNLLDWRSHRLPRVGRSSYAVETMGLEEGVDAAILIRGMFAELRGHDLRDKAVRDRSIDTVTCIAVVDAVDTHDKVSKDTASHGQQRSLAFTVAWLRQMLRRPNMFIRWTATENMLSDALTKAMDSSQLVNMLMRGTWSISFNADFVRSKKGSQPLDACTKFAASDLPGSACPPADSALLNRVSHLPGWQLESRPTLIAFFAKSFRGWRPRVDEKKYPLRSTFVSVDGADGAQWRCLERRQPSTVNGQEGFGSVAHKSVTFFDPV